jgi:hypothetical protein
MSKQTLPWPADPVVKDRERGAFAGDDDARRNARQSLVGSTAQPGGPPAGEADAYGLAEFCARHRISLQMYYKLAQQGLAPQTFNVGSRVLVSKEAAARWRAEREAASAAKTAETTP